MAYRQSFLEKMSEESFDFVCTNCEEIHKKVIEAVRYCIDCNGYCCQPCTDSHRTFPALRNHNLLDASMGSRRGNQTPSLPEFPIERCGLHKGEVLKLYCEVHDEVVCSTCIATSHKSCPGSNIHSVPDKINTLFQLVDVNGVKRHLKDKISSITALSNSTDVKLDALQEAKREAVKQVEIFEKALISIIRKSAEDSKSEIDAKFQELENDILQDKHKIDAVNDELQQSEGKLKKSDGNRAQGFTCSKEAEKKLKEADSLIIRQDKRSDPDKPLSFSPNQSVMNYLNGLHGVGQVYVRRKKLDRYRIKGQRDIKIKISGDSNVCDVGGCCLTQDNKLLVTDFVNKQLKRVDLVTLNRLNRVDLDSMKVKDSCKLDGQPVGVCCISDMIAAVACNVPGIIQFVSIDKKMSPTRQIKLSHWCYDIAYNNDKLYVTAGSSSLYVYNMDGTLIKHITCDNTRTRLFRGSSHITFNENRDKMFVADDVKGVVCFDKDDTYISTIRDSDLKKACGVCVDNTGNLFVTGMNSHNVIQYDEEGKKIGVILQQQDGLYKPQAVCYHQKLNRLFVTMENSDVVKMYELE